MLSGRTARFWTAAVLCRFWIVTLQITQRGLRFFDIGWSQDDETLFRFAAGCEIDVFDVDFRIREALGDLGSNARLTRGFDHEHFGLQRQHTGFGQEHERLGRIAYDHPHDRVIDRVRCSQRVDVNFGFGQCVTHARKRPGTICKKDRKLGGRFDGDLGRWVHGVSKSRREWLLNN